MINPQDIKQLRTETGLGLNKCQEALTKAQGKLDQARELLEQEVAKVVAKLAGRPMKEGAVFTKSNEHKTCAVLIKLGSETDFVARNDRFRELGEAITQAAIAHKVASKEAVLELRLNGKTVKQQIGSLVAATGENIDILDYKIVEASLVGHWSEGKKGAIVAAKGANPQLVQAVTDLATQLALSGYNPNLSFQERLTSVLAQPFFKKPLQTVGAWLQELPQELTIINFERSTGK